MFRDIELYGDVCVLSSAFFEKHTSYFNVHICNLWVSIVFDPIRIEMGMLRTVEESVAKAHRHAAECVHASYGIRLILWVA